MCNQIDNLTQLTNTFNKLATGHVDTLVLQFYEMKVSIIYYFVSSTLATETFRRNIIIILVSFRFIEKYSRPHPHSL